MLYVFQCVKVLMLELMYLSSQINSIRLSVQAFIPSQCLSFQLLLIHLIVLFHWHDCENQPCAYVPLPRNVTYDIHIKSRKEKKQISNLSKLISSVAE